MGGTFHIEVDLAWQDDPNKRLSTIKWSGDFSVDSGGTLNGSGKGTLHIDGSAFSQDTFEVVGTWLADATFDVSIGGGAASENAGTVLSLMPAMTNFTVGSITFHAPGYEKGMMASLNEITPSVAEAAFAQILLKPDQLGPVQTGITAGDFKGSATLTPIVY